MQAHYGYIQGHKGNDGDDMDVFIGVAPENDTVYIVNQKTADGYFDEHKIMLGFLSQQQAVDTYTHCFERGMTGLMSVVPCTMTQFKWWLANGNKSRPVTLDRLPYAGLERLDSVNWGGTDGSNLYSHDGQVHKLLYQIRQCDDTHQALEPLAYHDMIAELGNQGFMYENYDALIVEYNKLEKKAKQLLMVMQGAADTVKPVGVTVSKPLTKGGVANVVAWFEMDDGQAVGVFFHNPDKTPKKIDPTDEMISYKWVLNKKDITIAVAPEQGKDLVIRTVAKRIMQLVEKNHERFVKANGDKAALNQTEQDLSAQVTEKQATLKGLQDEVVALQARKAEKEAAQLAQEKVIEPVVQEPEATLSNRFAEHDAIAKQYGYSVNSSGVIFTPKGKNTGVKIGSPAGRLKISNAKELLFSGVNPTGLGKFLESYWYAEKTKAVVVPTVSAEQEPVTIESQSMITVWDSQQADADFAVILAQHNGDYVAASKVYFAEKLLGTSVQTKIGKVWINDTTKRKMQHRLSKTKARVVNRIPEILIDGSVGERTPLDKQRDDKIVAFYQFDKWLDFDDVRIHARIKVGEVSKGKLAYYLAASANEEAPSFDSSGADSDESLQPKGLRETRLDSIQADDDDDVNIEILEVVSKVQPVSQPVTLTGKELGDFPDTPEGKKELRAAAKAEFEKLLGQWVDCPALGGKVELRKSGMKKVLSLSADSRKLEIIPMLKSLISSSVKVDSVKSNDALIEQNIKAYHILRSKVTLDNELLAVRLVIREDDKGQYHYDHAITESLAEKLQAEKSLSEDRLDSMTATNGWGVADDSVKPTNIVRHQLDSILDSGAWVVNLFIEGEPLEVLEEETTPNPDRDYLQSIIDGKADLEAKGITTKIRQIILTAKDASDTDMLELADKAARAYATYVKAKAVAKLAEVQ